AQGHTQEEGIDYDEVFSPFARIEAIRLFLAYASFMGFTVYQMDVKSAFLYGTIDEEVEFKALMHEKFQTSSMGELNFFLGLQVLQKEDGIFLSQDNDYGGATQDCKSTTGGCQFMGRRLISWQCKKQTIVATSTTKAEYVAAASCYGQVLWIQNQLLDYEIRHHFIRDCFEKKLISVDHIYTDENATNLLTKPFDAGRFQYLVCKLFPLLGKLSTVSVLLGFGLTFAGTPKYWDILRILMINLRLIPLFWSTARIKTTEEGAKILATVDGILRTVTESSLRRNLKLNDEEGISSLPDAELFENLTLMGYNIYPNQKFTFQKGQFSHQWKYLIHTIMQCMSPKITGFNEFSSNIATTLGEGSGTPTKPHHTPSPEAQPTSPTTYSLPTLPPVTTAPIPTVTLSVTPHLRQYTRRARIAQSLILPPIADEPASPLRDVSQGEACHIFSSFEAEQDMANIAKTSTLPYESTSRVTSLAADEGTQEFEINSLKARIKLLEDKDRGVAEHSGDDAPIKGKRLDVGEEAAERVSDDTEEMETVLTSMDAATILASRVAKVPTGSSSIPTVGPLLLKFPLAVMWFPMLIMIDGLDRSNETIAKYLQEYHQFATEFPFERRIDLISGLVRYQDNYAKVYKFQTQQRKAWSKKQKRDYYMAVIKSNLGWKVKDFRGMTFEEIEAKFTTVWKQIENFIPMSSKEEAKRFKRKGIRFEQESTKKLKTLEEVKASEEVPEEKVKEMMQLVLIEEHLDREDLNQLWALVKESLNIRPALIEWKLYDTCGVHHVTSKDKQIFMLVEKDYPLRKGLAIVMICYKLQVENYYHMASDLILKIHKIANHPRQEDD
nr:hypothetical protein [Tanacetum cinerariifolium]